MSPDWRDPFGMDFIFDRIIISWKRREETKWRRVTIPVWVIAVPVILVVGYVLMVALR